ncbi:SH3 domain-containing protein [Adhaeribacter pallidiroseus]|uniref:SH3b domain-containing protein n=1 Tax=Adhaeribacter pallidiroseus TaxID=2072847 RepID=A0A369QL55_9BACT|nr:SH3 domain-containing protein [Adhaeribacter pallidiroseus]RDC63956.1 hypothetical protein AHMF7616_02565 [Adhaeribacter pallidiroseus]
MKKLLLSFALLVQVGFAMAADKNPYMVVQVRNDQVKMFQQPGTSTPIVETLTTADRVELVRKWNAHWALVKVNAKVGYILFSELTYLQNAPQEKTLAKR